MRNPSVQDLFYSAGRAKPGFVAGSGAVEIAQARDTFAHGRDCTDGLRAIGFWITRPPALSEVELLDWDPGLACRAADVAATRG